MDTSARLAAIAEGDGYDDSGLAAITLTGAGQDMVDGPDLLDPLFGTEGRDLRLPDLEPRRVPCPRSPPRAYGSGRAPGRRSCRPGRRIPRYWRRRSPNWSAWWASNR
ncbi:hypothetical protein SHKM778_62040 [Streptomyces sp. KM77-8]|uniref:Uncharacterized protein n=1 Tax=Streptomyces haneummycinicus TaxID=3074435 RepID=A0AAT9HQZ4_9ACTN